MNILRCSDKESATWDRFVSMHGDRSFYHLYAWRAINAECFGHESAYLAAIDGDEMVGVLPIVRLKSRLFGNIACSMPFVNYAGVLSTSEAADAALLEEARVIAESWGVEYLELRSRRDVNSSLPHSQHKVSVSVQLDRDPEKLWAGFKSGHRQEVRRAAKHGFRVVIGAEALLDDFYAVLSESWRDLGTPIYPKRYFQAILRAFPGRLRVAVVYAGDVPAAAAFDGFSGTSTVEGMWMGARAEYRSKGVNYVLYWELIKNACESGFQRYHLGRSTADSGGETFKKKWNAQVEQLYWMYILCTRQSIPQLNVSNPKYRFAIRAWQQLPVPITQFVGPLFARSIP